MSLCQCLYLFSPCNLHCFSRMATSFIHLYVKNTFTLWGILKLYCKKLTDPISLYLPQSWLNCSNVRKVRLLALLESVSNEKWKAGGKADTACFKSFPIIAFEGRVLRVHCRVLSHKILNTAVWVSLAGAAANSYIKGENVKVHGGHFSC